MLGFINRAAPVLLVASDWGSREHIDAGVHHVPSATRPQRRLRGTLIALFAVLPMFAAGQEDLCDRSLVAPRDNLLLGYRLRGDRCEGLYGQDVSGSLHLVSLTESFEDYDATLGLNLSVTWSVERAATVWLRAQSLKRTPHFRMDTRRPSGNVSYAWPTGLLASLQLRKRDVGVVGWFERTIGGIQQRVYLPLRITQRHAPVLTGSYQVMLLPERQLERVRVTLAPVMENGRLGSFLKDGEPLPNDRFPPGQPIAISVSPRIPGLYYLEIGADLAGAGIATERIYLQHVSR
jgi:hypothetical protein